MVLEYGASIGRVIRAATADGAELLGLGRNSGRLVPGSPADILLISSNPLYCTAAFREPVAVVKDRVLYRSSELTALFPNP